MGNIKIIVWCVLAALVVFIISIIGGSFYMLDYSLSPNPERTDTARCFREQFKTYPETQPWIDSLRKNGAIRDTFITMPTEMVRRLYEAKSSKKELWITEGAEHAQSYAKHKEEYVKRIKDFLCTE